ncbi:hypothetical protein F511_33047 [Dorcoceras hygrometricum]|uniref:Uncharacterized protein n=1 Tax=Dorcoceras hygrometricum TaxID=472368 RepID=A0A2Z7CCF7_9LAMI|nr:hypothetical protein F511_33047 [Dorcoceras hygrometricum]
MCFSKWVYLVAHAMSQCDIQDALSVIPRGSWDDVARRFTMIRWCKPTKELRFRSWTVLGVVPTVQPFKGQFPRGTGRSQTPKLQQVGSGSTTAPTVASELGLGSNIFQTGRICVQQIEFEQRLFKGEDLKEEDDDSVKIQKNKKGIKTETKQ